MNEQTRYRITGSLFVAALAIIFLPMLFDGAGVKALSLPAMSHSTQLSSKQKLLKPIKKSRSKQAVSAKKAASSPSFEKADALKEKVASMQAQARIGETVFAQGHKTPTGKEIWGVQLGSFSSEENAQKFKQKLQDDGFHAVLSRSQSSGSTITRVAVGPLIRESDAEKLLQKLSNTYKVKAILVNFEN